MNTCIKCGGTHKMLNGQRCDCMIANSFELPVVLDVPIQYQGVKFNKAALPRDMQEDYGPYMMKLYEELLDSRGIGRNILVCAPPNSGKTVFAYTIYAEMVNQGASVAKLLDLMEVRELLMSYYHDVDREQLALLSSADVAFIKIPQDLPIKFAEIISTVIERRVRSGGSTIFLFSGSKKDLEAQDRFGKFRALEGDGSYNSLKIYSWERRIGC